MSKLYSTKKIQLKPPNRVPFSAYRSNFSMWALQKQLLYIISFWNLCFNALLLLKAFIYVIIILSITTFLGGYIMDDYYNHISDKQAKLYIISIAGVIVSIVLGIILYPLFAVTSLDGALGFSDFLFYIFLRIITSLIYIIAQILMINNCRGIKKHDKNNAEKFIKETKQMSLKVFLIWLLFFIIGCVRIYNIIWWQNFLVSLWTTSLKR